MVISELRKGPFPYFKNNRSLPPDKVQMMKAKGVSQQTPELLSSDPTIPSSSPPHR
jgi:hypothetical protein